MGHDHYVLSLTTQDKERSKIQMRFLPKSEMLALAPPQAPVKAVTFTRFGRPVNITAARLIPVWIEQSSRFAKPRWFYSEPSGVPSNKISHHVVWHWKGSYTDNDTPVCEGRWANVGTLAASDGRWTSVIRKMERLNPEACAVLEQCRMIRRKPALAFPALEPQQMA